MGERFTVKRDGKKRGEKSSRDFFDLWVDGMLAKKSQITLEVCDTLTPPQRGALHVWCEQYAQALNDAGFLRKKVLFATGEVVEVDWSMLTFKEDVYKVMLEALSGKTSTEQQTTVEPSEVANHINRYFAESRGFSIPWPSRR